MLAGRSLPLTSKILKVYILVGFSCIPTPDGLNNTLLSQVCVLENSSHSGNGRWNMRTSQAQGWGEEPLIAWVQLVGQTRGHALSMTSFNNFSLIWNNNVLCSPSLLPPSCSMEFLLDGWSSCHEVALRMEARSQGSHWSPNHSIALEHLPFKLEKNHFLSYLNPYNFGVFSLNWYRSKH